MNMKKIAPLAMTALLLGGTATYASDVLISPSPTEQQQEATFMQVTGKVDAIEVRGDWTYYIDTDEANGFYVTVQNSQNVYDTMGNAVTLKEGDTFTAYIYANQPMILIYPPHYTAQAIIKDTEGMGTAMLGTFDKNLVNETNTLKLNIADTTAIYNTKGEKIANADFTGGDAIVFYTTSTRSIPAQTTPSKIVQLPGLGADWTEEEGIVTPEEEIDAIVGTDFRMVNGTKMVPLRTVAEQLGYQVASTGKGAIISKGVVSYTVTRGEKMYGYNRALRQFTEVPALLEKNKTYVEYDFALQLVD